jgi:hypothetical protein
MNELLIQLISGAVGGNAAGAALKEKGLGALGNTITGLLGGAGIGQLLASLAPQLLESLAGQIGGAGVGGAVVTAIIGIIKSKMAAK